MEDMEIRHEDSFIFTGVTVDTLIEDICELSINEYSNNRHVHQPIKDKINVSSSYLDLYFTTGDF